MLFRDCNKTEYVIHEILSIKDALQEQHFIILSYAAIIDKNLVSTYIKERQKEYEQLLKNYLENPKPGTNFDLLWKRDGLPLDNLFHEVFNSVVNDLKDIVFKGWCANYSSESLDKMLLLISKGFCGAYATIPIVGDSGEYVMSIIDIARKWDKLHPYNKLKRFWCEIEDEMP